MLTLTDCKKNRTRAETIRTSANQSYTVLVVMSTSAIGTHAKSCLPAHAQPPTGLKLI